MPTPMSPTETTPIFEGVSLIVAISGFFVGVSEGYVYSYMK